MCIWCPLRSIPIQHPQDPSPLSGRARTEGRTHWSCSEQSSGRRKATLVGLRAERRTLAGNSEAVHWWLPVQR